MTSTENTTHGGMDAVLASLPSACIIARQSDARLVVGPTGAFVLLPADGDLATVRHAAEELADLVHETRNALCDQLTWVPFLDALLVTGTHPPREFDVSAAPLDLVHDVLTEGPTVITLGTLNGIRDALRSDRIKGWSIGAGPADGNINLRDPAQPSRSR